MSGQQPTWPLTGEQQRHRKRRNLLFALCLVAAALLIIDALSGPSGISITQFWAALHDGPQSTNTQAIIVWQLRLPQTLMAALTGAALGLAGAEMQTVLDNPLASPFTLGISSAAALGAALALILQWYPATLPKHLALVGWAFFMALLCAFVLDLAARTSRAGAAGLVLLGIALVFSFNAVLSLLQLIANPHALQDLLFWTMGSLARSDWPGVLFMATVLLAMLPLAQRQAWALTALRFGDDRAAGLGADPQGTRRYSLLRSSLLAATSVSLVGVIGFVGLMGPHIARRLWGDNQRWYLPGSALTGAVIVLGASVLAKFLGQEINLPVGIVTTLVGIPFFMLVVLRRRHH